jgi:glutamine amidotransferase
MQLFAEESEEKGSNKGLGWIPGKVRLIDSQNGKLSIPQVGWNTLTPKKSTLLERVPPTAHFYFDHSFHFDCPSEFRSSTVNYGADIVASVERGSLFGVQFHPEKSQVSGLKLLRGYLNFVAGRSARC